MDLTSESLAAFLRSSYPDREPADDEAIASLMGDLGARNISTVAELERMLARTSDAFQAHEREAPPNGTAGARYAAVGAVRVSISLESPDIGAPGQPARTVAHGEPEIPALAAGEERLLQTVHRADGNRNDIYLVHRRPTDDAGTGAGDPVNFVAIIRYTDQDPTDTSPPWAWQRGPTERSIYIRLAEATSNAPPLPGSRVELHPDVQWFVDRISERYGPEPTQMETIGNWVGVYVAACGDVLSAANACLEVANLAVAARNTADKRPQHESSIKAFRTMAEAEERKLLPLYATFDEACSKAREAAAQLVAGDPAQAEMVLAMSAADDVLDNVATAKGILAATYGPSPTTFLHGVDAANALLQNPTDGNIYRPIAAASASGERTCPWCAETIKAAAVICRFCNRDVRTQPNS